MPPRPVRKTHDRILWVCFLCAMSLYALAEGATLAIGLGEAAHDAFCVDHGWMVS